MIIGPVRLSVLMHPYSGQSHIIQRNFVTLPYQNDRAEFSFTGTFESSKIPVHLEQAQQYSGIHCPGCGTPMLSEHDFECIIKKSANAKNAKELITLIQNNKKFVAPKFSQIFEDMAKIENPQEMSIPEFRVFMSNCAYARKKEITHSTRDYLRGYASFFPDEVQQKAVETVDGIRTKQIYQVQKDKIVQFTKDLELDVQYTNQVLAKTLKPLFIANGYFMLFNSSKLPQMQESDYGEFIIDRLFYPSVNKVVKISKFPIHDNLENNKVIICNACNQNQQKMVFWKSENYRDIKENMRSYLTDISYLMGDDKMELAPGYFNAFTTITGKLSKQKISFNPSEVQAIKNVGRSVKRHERFAPIEQTKVDIPCADCGSVMLPHAKRKEIEKELKACNTPLEYSKVLDKNMKYVGKNFRILAHIFKDIVNENPKISNEEFVKEFTKREADYTDKALQKTIKGFLENRTYVAKNYPPEYLEVYDDFTKRMLKYMVDGKFNDFDVSSLYCACISDMEVKRHSVKQIYVFLRNLSTISFRHLCAVPETKHSFGDKDPVYTILFNMFKYNVATADHLTAEIKGGQGDKYNLIGLCKSCNRTKSQKNVHNWYIENKYIGLSLQKQLKTVDKMAKSGQLEGYDDWAKTIAQRVYEQTYGKLDLRKDFE